MRVVITGGAGFIGRAVVERLAGRGNEVVALVRDTGRARFLKGDRVKLVASDLSDASKLAQQMERADAVIHAAGAYRIGIGAAERQAMWDANVGATQRVIDATVSVEVKRIVYVSTLGVFGDTRGQVVDESYRRDVKRGFLSWYDETKFRAHEAAEERIKSGAPVLIVQPGQTYGPHDHSEASALLEQAYRGRLRFVPFPSTGLAWVHVHDLADAIVAALERGRVGESYALGGDRHRLGEAVAIAARLGGHRPPRMNVPTSLLRAISPVNDRFGGLPGLPANLRETIDAAENVTYWAKHDKATAELGFKPRSLEQGIVDTWAESETR